ncbi:MAG: hypothetical protein IPP91_12810 [Betaproteobacteria bacterium]|nr:hypothetical protein [Betaproteobacteria bacterium]
MRTASRLIALVAGLLAVILSTGAMSASDEPSVDQLIKEARELIWKWNGERGILIEADKLINEALRRDPKSVEGRITKAKLLVRVANSSNPPRTQPLEMAEAYLKEALALDPGNADAYSALGFVYLHGNRLPDAKAAFLKNNELKPDDAWSKLALAEYYKKAGDEKNCVRFSEEAVALASPTDETLLKAALFHIHVHYSRIEPDRKKADDSFRKLLKLSPEDAFLRGDHARNLMLHFSDFNAGETLIRETLVIQDYPHARQTLSLALYGKWAVYRKAGAAPTKVETAYREAQANDPNGAYLPGCALSYPSMKVLVEALESKRLAGMPHQRC